MRRIDIAFALSTLLLASICSAQQTATTPQPDTVINCVGAKNGTIPIWTGSAPPNITLCNSGIYEASPYGTGSIGILNPNPMAALDVTGATNTSLYYQIGESTVLSIGSAADANLFLGVGAGASNVAGRGQGNTFSGSYAGYSDTIGYDNTFSGYAAGHDNTSGTWNTFYGWRAGYSNTTGNENTFYGTDAGFYNTTGVSNTFSGTDAGWNNTSGYYNTFYGNAAGSSNTSGHDNTFYGFQAGYFNTGTGNTFYGTNAGGNNTTGNNDIYIGNLACPYPCSESSTIRIGGDVGTGYGTQTAAYIAGIYGTTASGSVPVYINSNGQLGTSASSLRFKEQVRDMGDNTNALMKLRPVTFLYKSEYDKGERTLQYGLIAEEVAKVYPELVAYDNVGQPYSVRYQHITTMLLNELQKQYHRAEAEAKVMTAQQQKIDELEQRLSRLETLIGNQVRTLAQE